MINSISRLLLLSCDMSDHNWNFIKTVNISKLLLLSCNKSGHNWNCVFVFIKTITILLMCHAQHMAASSLWKHLLEEVDHTVQISILSRLLLLSYDKSDHNLNCIFVIKTITILHPALLCVCVCLHKYMQRVFL